MPPKHSAKKGTNKGPNKSGAKGAPNNKSTRKNNGPTKFLTQQEIANMESMKKEFQERMEKLLGVIRETNAKRAHLNKVIYAINKINQILKDVRVDKDGRLPVKEIKLNPSNIVVREIFLNEFDKDFAATRHCYVKRHAEPTDLIAWRGTDELRVKEHKFTIESKLLYGGAKDGWSGAPGSWKNVPKNYKANLAAKTMFQPGSVVVLSYGGEPTRIVGVFKEYTGAELGKVDDLKFCLKPHWVQTGLLYDENPEKGWELPAGWTGPKLISYLKLD